MSVTLEIKSIVDEQPSNFADRMGQIYAQTVTTQHKKDNGQFFTPTKIAHFMANLAKKSMSKLKILDPGCGTAILSISLIEELVKETSTDLKEIELVVFETDQDVLPYTQFAIDYLEKWLKQYNVKLISKINTNDFVLENKDCFEKNATLFFEPLNGTFDIVISNPPYFKIAKEDKRAVVAKSVVWGQPNIYSIFLMVAARLLKQGGELIFITPRSFTSGNYFRAFRETFLQEIKIQQIHLFGSRRDAFDRDNVLQETLILKGTKQKMNGHSSSILVTHSNGIKDIDNYTENFYRIDELIDLNSKEKIIHLPTNETDDNVIKLFKSWPASLQKYGIQISTGPVVSFRATKYLFDQYQNGTIFLVPLYQLINTSKMDFQ